MVGVRRSIFLPSGFPRIIVLCGSTRFFGDFREMNLRLTLAGYIVLSIGCDTKSDGELSYEGRPKYKVKRELDELHKRKIDLADYVYVINREGYIGRSTQSEIDYATANAKPIIYMEP